MLLDAKHLVVVLCAALFAHAQTTSTTGTAAPTSIPAIPPCVQNCVNTAATGAGCSPVDPMCLCTNTAFQTAAATCLAGCTPAEQAAAVQLQGQVCGALASGTTATGAAVTGTGAPGTTRTGSVTGSVTTAAAGTGTGTGTGTAATGASTATSTTSSAMGKYGLSGLGVVVALMGACLGAEVVL